MSKPYKYPTNPEVRAWADERFYDVPKTGRLPRWVIEAWNEAHPVRKYDPEQAHHGTVTGYIYHGCRETCCESVWTAYQANYYATKAAA